jgi:hypothetical protein
MQHFRRCSLRPHWFLLIAFDVLFPPRRPLLCSSLHPSALLTSFPPSSLILPFCRASHTHTHKTPVYTIPYSLVIARN